MAICEFCPAYLIWKRPIFAWWGTGPISSTRPLVFYKISGRGLIRFKLKFRTLVIAVSAKERPFRYRSSWICKVISTDSSFSSTLARLPKLHMLQILLMPRHIYFFSFSSITHRQHMHSHALTCYLIDCCVRID